MRTVFQGSDKPYGLPWNQNHRMVGGGNSGGGGGGDVVDKKFPAHGAAGRGSAASAGTVAWRGGNVGDCFGGYSGGHRQQQAAKSLSASGSTANVGNWDPATQWPDSGASKWNQATVSSCSGGRSFGWTNGGGVHQLQPTEGPPVNGPSAATDARGPPDTTGLAMPLKPWTSMAGGGTWSGGGTGAGGGAPLVPFSAFDRRSDDKQQQLQPPVPAVLAAGAAAMRTASPLLVSGEGWRMLI